MKECKSKELLTHFRNIIYVSLKELFGQPEKNPKTSRSHTKRHQDIINCYKGKTALLRGPHPSIVIWMRGQWRASTSGTFCWINGTANSKKNMARVITTTYLNIHYFQNTNVSKVHPSIKNIFRIKLKHASLHQQGDQIIFQKIGQN